MAFFLLRLSDHLQYLGRVRAALEESPGAEPFQGVDHRSCQLGIWLQDPGPEAEGMGTEGEALLADLRLLHEQFHAASWHALHLRSDPDQAQPYITELFRLSAKLADLMVRLDRLGLRPSAV